MSDEGNRVVAMAVLFEMEGSEFKSISEGDEMVHERSGPPTFSRTEELRILTSAIRKRQLK